MQGMLCRSCVGIAPRRHINTVCVVFVKHQPVFVKHAELVHGFRVALRDGEFQVTGREVQTVCL